MAIGAGSDANQAKTGRVERSFTDRAVALERGILGAAIIEHDYISNLAELPQDFFTSRVHNVLARTLVEMWLHEEDIDPMTIHAALLKQGEHGLSISDIVSMTSDSLSLNFLGDLELLNELYRRRKLTRLGAVLMHRAQDETIEPETLVSDVMQELSAITSPETDKVLRFWEIANPIILEAEAGILPDAIPTGFSMLDDMIGRGLHRGTLTIIAGRPSMGKSVLATQIATHAAKSGRKVLLISLEMSAKALVTRIMASEAVVEPVVLRLSADRKMWQKVRSSLAKLECADLWICDDTSLTSVKAVALAKEFKVRHGVDLIVVDYIQRISDVLKSDESRNQVLGRVTKNFASLARQADCAVILVSQLNRRPDASADKRPGLADIRDSGEVEQDADNVFLLYREGYYNRNADPHKAELIVAKQREGPTGAIPLYWDAEHVRFLTQEGRYE